MEAADRERILGFLQDHPDFGEADPKALDRLLKASTLLDFRPGMDVVRQGEYGETLFLVLNGSVIVKLRRPSGEETVIAILRRGEVFGELSVLSLRPRSATVVANETLRLLEVPREAVGRLLKATPPLLRRLDRLYRYRVIASNLNADPLFEGLLPETLQQLVDNAELRAFQKDEVVILEGEPAETFYIVWSGHLRVSTVQDGEERIFSYLSEGDYFGETALIEGTRRTASVKANERCEVVTIRRDQFEQHIASDPELLARMKARAAERRSQAEAVQRRPDKMLFIEDMLKVGVAHATSALMINLDLCVLCGNCAVACHDRFGTSRLVRRGQSYLLPDSKARVLMPNSCWHCRDPECMIDCPTDALRRQPTGEISIIKDRCIGCQICANQCPWGNITMAEVRAGGKGSFPRRAAKALGRVLGRTPAPVETEQQQKKRIPTKAVKCDLCRGHSGGPACVAACPYRAIDLLNPNRYLLHALEGER